MVTIQRDGRDQDKTEALDGDCLRALGHPHDHAIRQELLSALEWDDSLHPAPVGPLPGNQLQGTRVDSADPRAGIPSGTGKPDGAGASSRHGIMTACRKLAARVHFLVACHGRRRPDQGI